MPAPVALAPIAWKAAALAAAGALAWRAAHRAGRRPLKADEEAVLDGIPDGADLTTRDDAGRARVDARGRLRRVVRLGPDGPGIALDAAALARLRITAVPAGARI